MDIDANALCSDGALSIRAAESFTQWSRAYLYQLMQEGALPYIKQGKTRRIPRKALVQLMAKGLQGGDQGQNPTAV